LADEKCNMVQSDKGAEFLNSTFQSMLNRRGMKIYTSEKEDLKAAVVERFNRTLKEKKRFVTSPTRILAAIWTHWMIFCIPIITRITDRLE